MNKFLTILVFLAGCNTQPESVSICQESMEAYYLSGCTVKDNRTPMTKENAIETCERGLIDVSKISDSCRDKMYLLLDCLMTTVDCDGCKDLFYFIGDC